MTAGQPIFVADQFIDGRRMRILIVVDNCTRECLALASPQSQDSGRSRARSVAGRSRQAEDDRQRQRHRVDFKCHPAMGGRSQSRLALYIAPGKPVQNAFAESFISRLRDELLQQLPTNSPTAGLVSTGGSWRGYWQLCRPLAHHVALTDHSSGPTH